MARLARLYVPEQPQHVILRGLDQQPAFVDDQDYELFIVCLRTASRDHHLSIHAYALMPQAVHLLVTPRDESSLPKAMQAVGRRYVAHFNRRYTRRGTLWEGRYRAAPIDGDTHFFSCCRYIELNPVRARMVRHPGDYPFSSYRANALGEADALVSPHPLFERLGQDVQMRRTNYRELFDDALSDEFVEALRVATNGGWALGDQRFQEQIAEAAKRRVAPLSRGRRSRAKAGNDQINLL
jgi:putative transposase